MPPLRRADPGSLPWWTWLLPLLVFHAGTQASLGFQVAAGTSLWYLPIPLGIVLVHWWGPRVLPALFLNAMLSAGLWGLPRVALWPLYALPETIAVGLSWLLAARLGRLDAGLPDLRTLLRFLALGLLIPITVGGVLVQGQLVLLGDLAAADFAWALWTGWVGDQLGGIAVALPLLLLATPALARRGLAAPTAALPPTRPPTRQVAELAALFALVALATRTTADALVWPLLGLASVWAAVRTGAAGAVLTTSWAVAMALLLPALLGGLEPLRAGPQLHPFLLGLWALCLAGAVTGRAVSDLRAEAERVRASERRFRRLVDALPDLVFRIGRDGTMRDVTVGDPARLAVPPERFLGRRLHDLPFPPDVIAFLTGGLADALAGGDPCVEYLLDMPDGPHRYEARFRQVADDEVLAVVRDVTRERAAQEREQHARRMESLGQLVGAVAHDFNNLLQVIGGYAGIARGRLPADSPADGALDRVEAAVERAQRLTGRLLAFARRAPLARRPLDANRLVAAALDLVRPALDPRIAVEVEATAAPATVVGDAAQLQDALLNLVFNARDAMPEGGRLRVATALRILPAADGAAGGEHVAISVADTGCGMAPEVLERACEPFFTTKSAGRGTGLGLAAVRGTLDEHGGRLAIASEPGAGTTVTLLLPLARDAVADESGPHPTIGAAGPAGDLVVVDDEEAIRDLVAEVMTARGWRVRGATDGAAGLALVRARRPDAVVLDLHMPGMDGRACLHALRAEFPGLPVVVATGYAPQRLDDEPAALLRKPFSVADLVAALAAARATR